MLEQLPMENSLLRSFGPIVWDNMVPQSMKEIANIDDFKKCIKTRIPINCPLCKDYVPNLGLELLG